MKIQFLGVHDNPQDARRHVGWLVPDKDYVVLEVYVDSRTGTIKFRVISEQAQTPALFSSSLFRVTSNYLSRRWVVEISDSEMKLAPERWNRPGYWEAFFDGDSQARAEFNEEVELLLSECS